VQIEQIGKIKVASLGGGGSVPAFCSRASYTLICETKAGDELFVSIILRLLSLDWTQCLRIGDRMVLGIQFP
jgi:hypothetical protein